MPQLYYDLLFCAAFVVIMLILIKFKRSAFAKDGAAFNRIMVGLLFLLGFSLIQFLGNQGVFQSMVYLSDPAGRKVIEAMGIVGGLIFLLSGIGSWLPSMIKGRENRRSLNRRYFCLKMINEALEREKDLGRNHETVINLLSSYLGFNRCAAYIYSSRQDTLHLSGTTGFDFDYPEAFRSISLDRTDLKKTLHRFRPAIAVYQLPDWNDSDGPDLIVPIATSERLYGAYFCWIGRGTRVDDDLLDFASVVGGMVGKHAHNLIIDVKQDYFRRQSGAFEQLNQLCNQVTAVRDLIPGLFKNIKGLVGAEYLSLATLDNSGENMLRYTIGSGGRLLLEKGVSRQTRGTDIFSAFEKRQPILVSEIHADEKSGDEDGLFLSCGMHSRLTYPIKAGEKVIGVLTLGHSRVGYFGKNHLHQINGLTDIISGVIRREQISRSLEVKEDHMLRLQLMQRQILENSPVQKFFDDACDLLTKRMKCTVARISLLDKSRKNLVSQACRSIRDTGYELSENEAIPLSLLPWHRTAFDAQKLMLINQDDPESRMPPQESTSALIPHIKSAMLIPIMLNDEAKGMISIGEARNWNRRSFNATDLIFAKDVAAKCSAALRMKQMQIDVEKSRDEMNRLALSGEEVLPEMRNRLKSPLTSIIGAVELLRMKGSPDEFSKKYYDLILKAADRIKLMTDEDFIRRESLGETRPEMVIG